MTSFDSIEVSKITESVESLKDYLATQASEICDEIYRVENLKKKMKINSALPWKIGKEPYPSTHILHIHYGKYARY